MKRVLLTLSLSLFCTAQEPPFATASSDEPTPFSREKLENHREKLEKERETMSQKIIDEAQKIYEQANTTTPPPKVETPKVEEQPKEGNTTVETDPSTPTPADLIEALPLEKVEVNTTLPSKKEPIKLNVNIPNVIEEESYDESGSNVNTSVTDGVLTVEIQNSREGDVALENINRCKTPYPNQFFIYKETKK